MWGFTHDTADGFVIDILTTFDNEFIMDMTADKAVGEVTHYKDYCVFSGRGWETDMAGCLESFLLQGSETD